MLLQEYLLWSGANTTGPRSQSAPCSYLPSPARKGLKGWKEEIREGKKRRRRRKREEGKGQEGKEREKSKRGSFHGRTKHQREGQGRDKSETRRVASDKGRGERAYRTIREHRKGHKGKRERRRYVWGEKIEEKLGRNRWEEKHEENMSGERSSGKLQRRSIKRREEGKRVEGVKEGVKLAIVPVCLTPNSIWWLSCQRNHLLGDYHHSSKLRSGPAGEMETHSGLQSGRVTPYHRPWFSLMWNVIIAIYFDLEVLSQIRRQLSHSIHFQIQQLQWNGSMKKASLC